MSVHILVYWLAYYFFKGFVRYQFIKNWNTKYWEISLWTYCLSFGFSFTFSLTVQCWKYLLLTWVIDTEMFYIVTIFSSSASSFSVCLFLSLSNPPALSFVIVCSFSHKRETKVRQEKLKVVILKKNCELFLKCVIFYSEYATHLQCIPKRPLSRVFQI